MAAVPDVEVRFEPAGAIARVAAGTTLLAASELAGVSILTGCTRGMCGTDAVRIVSGSEGLEAPAEHETGTLERMGLGSEYRLSCSARVRAGLVVVELDTF